MNLKDAKILFEKAKDNDKLAEILIEIISHDTELDAKTESKLKAFLKEEEEEPPYVTEKVIDEKNLIDITAKLKKANGAIVLSIENTPTHRELDVVFAGDAEELEASLTSAMEDNEILFHICKNSVKNICINKLFRKNGGK